MNRSLINHPPRLQQGVSTLLIAMLLLAILTIITLFAARFGVTEQRTSANEYRYKMAFHLAEAGLQQTVEYIKINTPKMVSVTSGGWLNPAASKWQPCSDPTTMSPDPCQAEPDDFRRQGMYRYLGGADNGVLPVAGFMPPLDTDLNKNQVGNFSAGYKSYAALCLLDMTNPASPQCSLNPTTRGDFYFTVVSRGALDGENSVATVKQSFGTFRTLGPVPAAPLIAASSSALGNTQIVPNPNGGGSGVPLSIWTSGNALVGGAGGASFATCHLGEWMSTGSPSLDDQLNGVCADCTCNSLCPGYGLLSGKANASCTGGSGPFESEDILDNDGGAKPLDDKVLDVKATDFPKSLFAYVFRKKCDQMYSASCPEVQKYLTEEAEPIPSATIADCSKLGTKGGLYWNKGTCSITQAQVGTLEEPVVLVSDTTVKISSNTRFFGLIFIRGGNGFDGAGGGQVYGAVVLEGDAAISGGPTIVYNKAVLTNIGNSANFVRYGPIAGSWSDSL